MISYVVTGAQFYRSVGVSVRNSVYSEQRRANGNMEQSCALGIGGNGANFFFGANHADAEIGLEQTVERAGLMLKQLAGQALEKRDRQIDVIDDCRDA